MMITTRSLNFMDLWNCHLWWCGWSLHQFFGFM